MLCLFTFQVEFQAQTPAANIATWKNDADGAYSIVHDDYGLAGADGIWQYADTIAYNRGIKFVFGVYTQLCETRTIQPNGYASLYSFAKNVMMSEHSHELANHSYTHACAAERGWSPCTFGPGQSGWGEAPLGADLDREINTAHNSIVNATGFVPQYYVYPYDVFSQATNQRLEDLGYLGSRTGWSSPAGNDSGQGYHREGYEKNDLNDFFPNSSGFFRNGVQVFNDNDAQLNWQGQLLELNGEIDRIIANNEYGNREFHNVGNSGWGHVKVDAYRGHMDYLKQKVEEGKLWVGTVSEIFTYQLQKLKFSPMVSYDKESGKIMVSWNDINQQYNVDAGDVLDRLTIKSPVTLVVDLNGLEGPWQITQNGEVLQGVLESGNLLIDLYPHMGDLVIQPNVTGNTPPYVDNALEDQVLQENFSPYQIDLTTIFDDAQTADGDLIYIVRGNSNLQVNLVNGLATISVDESWTGNETITFEVEDEGGLKITEEVLFIVNSAGNQTAYNGPHVIPGKIEAEDFDQGDEGEAYQEITKSWDPSPSANPYRVNHPVDIGDLGGGAYGIGYTQSGEWLEYTVSVTKTGNYNFMFRTSQVQDQSTPKGELKVLMSGVEAIAAVSSVYTSQWFSYTDVSVLGVFLNEGNHVLRIEFTQGNVNLDHVDITLSNEAPFVENPLSNYELSQNFDSFNIDLRNVFEDTETSDENLLLTVSGDENLNIDINEGMATVSLNQSWLGSEVITFTTTDAGGLTKDHLVVFEVKQVTNSIVTAGEKSFKIYPNPTSGRFTVFGKLSDIQVFDAQGHLLIQSRNNIIDLSAYPAGLYFVRIDDKREYFKVIKTP